MANQQRSVIVTAIILAVILGGALVWLLNRTPAEQLATQAPATSPDAAATGDQATQDLVTAEEANRLAQAQAQQTTPSPDPGQVPTTQLSPTDPNLQQSAPAEAVSGVSTTAPTGPAETAIGLAIIATILGGGGLLLLPRLNAFRE